MALPPIVRKTDAIPLISPADSALDTDSDAYRAYASGLDLDALDIVGIYPNYASAYKVWKQKAQQSVDNARMRYFIVHMHRLLDPEKA